MKPIFRLAWICGLALVCTACVQNESTPISQVPQDREWVSTGLSSTSVTHRINLGDAKSEAAHGVEFQNAPVVESAYPEFWIMSVRASSFLEGHDPYLVIDGDPNTTWQTIGKPAFPMVKGQFVEVEMNEPTVITDVSVQFIDDRPQNIKIYNYPFSDQRRLQFETTSSGTAEMETFTIEGGVFTRAIRIEYEPAEGGASQGIAEVRLDKVPFPSGYPPALDLEAPIDLVEREYYLEFQRFMKWPMFNLKRPLADGGGARVLMNTDEHEGGHLEFDIAVDPDQPNFITLKTWSTRANDHAAGGNSITLELIVDDPVYNGRWMLPTYVTRQHVQVHEWYGNKPTPGQWAYATFELPEAATQGQSQVRLRLQGIGNARRDRAMIKPATPIYEISSRTALPFKQ